jgi:hypothetical protein
MTTPEDYGYILYGAVRSLLLSNKYYKKAVYSFDKPALTAEGECAVISLINMIAPSLLSAVTAEDAQRAKEMVMSELIKENI